MQILRNTASIQARGALMCVHVGSTAIMIGTRADRANPGFDQRMVSIAVTGIQEAFMWANRAVFQPTRVKLPGDAP